MGKQQLPLLHVYQSWATCYLHYIFANKFVIEIKQYGLLLDFGDKQIFLNICLAILFCFVLFYFVSNI